MKKLSLVILIMLIICILILSIFFISFPLKYKKEIEYYSKEFGLSKQMVASVINIESGYDKTAKSKAGAIGLMQLLPSTAIDCATRMGISITEDDLYNVDVNIRVGCYYLSYLLELFDQNIINTLCAYNWGLGNVKNWIAIGNVDKNGTITNIPIKETSEYIQKYRTNYFVYEKLYKFK